jgi:hypothetical protein
LCRWWVIGRRRIGGANDGKDLSDLKVEGLGQACSFVWGRFYMAVFNERETGHVDTRKVRQLTLHHSMFRPEHAETVFLHLNHEPDISISAISLQHKYLLFVTI